MNRETTMEQLVDIELVTLSNNNNSNECNACNNSYHKSLELTNATEPPNTQLTNSYYNIWCLRRDIVETGISVSIHTFIMAVFEIYFYFGYVVVIEKKMFIDKIDSYTYAFNAYYDTNVSDEEHSVLVALFPQSQMELLLNKLYIDYKRSLEDQKELLDALLLQSYKMLVVVTSVLVLFFTLGFYSKKNIHWKKIVADNILMFVSLGIFEYIFFNNIILKYSPVTDAEIKYEIVKNMLVPLTQNSTYSRYN